MINSKHIIISIFLSLLIIASGTMGYIIIEGWTFFDSLYMTVITLTTVGYEELHPISQAGRMFTIILIFTGAGVFIYLAGGLVQFVVEGRIRAIFGRRRLDQRINRLKNHYIICGYGRIGQIICQRLREKPLGIVVVEKDESLIPAIDDEGIPYVSGEASDETILIKAGIQKARAIVAALGRDSDNVFLVLTARQLNPDIFIMARAGAKESKSKLYAAGANKVESPYEIGGESIARRILRPAVTSFLDLAFENERKDIKMEEARVDPSSALAGVALKDSGIRQRFNLIIIAIKKSDGGMIFNPSFETLIKGGDTVIAIGEEKNLIKLEKILHPDSR